MINFKINGKSYPFPTQWSDVTYQQYIDLLHTSRLTDHIHVFTGIPKETLLRAEIPNLEKISIALSFLSFTPNFPRTDLVGRYLVPSDVTIQSLGQFEDLRSLAAKIPKDRTQIESIEKLSDLYLSACAIYCQKERDGEYDYTKTASVKEELKNYPCNEVIGVGGFFLFKPSNSSTPIMRGFQKVVQHLKKLSQGLPGYRMTLDFLLRYLGSAGK